MGDKLGNSAAGAALKISNANYITIAIKSFRRIKKSRKEEQDVHKGSQPCKSKDEQSVLNNFSSF